MYNFSPKTSISDLIAAPELAWDCPNSVETAFRNRAIKPMAKTRPQVKKGFSRPKARTFGKA